MLNRIAQKIYNEYRLSIIAKRVFDAALTDQQKTLVDEYTNQRKQDLSFGPMFSSDRTYFNLGNSNLSIIETPKEISDILDKEGYYCPDYREGYVYKKDDKLKSKPVKLLRVLKKGVSDNQQFNMLKKQFDQRLGTSRKQMVNCLICITHNPYDVAGMSTDRNWTSCMELPDEDDQGGCYYDTALKQVQYGGMCAYLIQDDDKEIEIPIARIAIKRLVGKYYGFIFVAQNRIYGDEDFANQLNFMREVNNILEKSNEKTMNNERIFERNDSDSYSDSNMHGRYMFKDNGQMIQYFKEHADFLKNTSLIKLLSYEKLHELFFLLIKDKEIDYRYKSMFLYGLICKNKLTKQQEILVINIMVENHDIQHLYWLIKYHELTNEQTKIIIDAFIKEQDVQHLFQLIKENKFTEEQQKLIVDMLIKKQETKCLSWLADYNKLTKEQLKSAIDVFIKKGTGKILFSFLYYNKLTEDQQKPAIDALIKNDYNYELCSLIKNAKLTPEQKKLVINAFIEKQDAYSLYMLVLDNNIESQYISSVLDVFIKKQHINGVSFLMHRKKLTEEQFRKALNFLFKKKNATHLYENVYCFYDKLTEEQKKQLIDIFIKSQNQFFLYWLMSDNRLTPEKRKLVIKILLKKNSSYLSHLNNKLTDEQIQQFNLGDLKQD